MAEIVELRKPVCEEPREELGSGWAVLEPEKASKTAQGQTTHQSRSQGAALSERGQAQPKAMRQAVGDSGRAVRSQSLSIAHGR
jgi:hypothetical protein